MSISLALSIFVLLISLMHLVHRAQFLIIIFCLLFGFVAVPVFEIVIIAFASIYASLRSH